MCCVMLIFTSCHTIERGSNVGNALPKERKSVEIGVMHAGIVENTDMSLIDGATPDAFSGATSPGFSGALHYERKLGNNYLITGLDLMISSQQFTYHDNELGYHGTREICVTSFRVPIMYQWGIFRKTVPEGWLKVHAGLSMGYSHFKINNSGQLPESYTTYPFSIGPTFGGSITPYRGANGSCLSLSTELWRSFSPAFTDLYNVGDQSGMSYGKIGVVYHLPIKTN